MTQKYVIVRDHRAGVYAGEFVEETASGITLANARHIWQWTDRLSTADIAARGVTDGAKVVAPVPHITLYDRIAKIGCTVEAERSIREARAWRR